MKEAVTKSTRISSKDLGISLFPTSVSPEYWAKKKEQQARWAKEDAEREAAKTK